MKVDWGWNKWCEITDTTDLIKRFQSTGDVTFKSLFSYSAIYDLCLTAFLSL